MIKFIVGIVIIAVVSVTSTVAYYEGSQWWTTAVWALLGANAGFWVAHDGMRGLVSDALDKQSNKR